MASALVRGEIQFAVSGEKLDVSRIVEGKCYKALEKIKAIIEDDSLEDNECFMKIEEIVIALEDIGSSGGCRHDFG